MRWVGELDTYARRFVHVNPGTVNIETVRRAVEDPEFIIPVPSNDD
jgi:hypothetical protein